MEKTIFRDYLTIDAETRKISIPSRIKNLGVESDANVKRLYFKVQKQYGEMDFTKADIRINYVNANGEGDYYPVADKQVEGGTVTFSWLVGRNATEYKGDVCFIVCAKISDIEGIVKKEFNTTLATLPVLEGKETTQQIVQQYPDVIEQILKKLEGATTITPEQIQAAVDAYLKKNPITVKETDPTVPEWAKQPQKPAYTASEVDAEEKGAVEQHNSDSQAHPDIRRMINELPGGGGGTTDYNSLENKPQINGRELVGDKTLEELGLQIPTKLPNPHILTFTGAVAETYDGSKEVTIDIPSGGDGSGAANYVTPEEFGARGDGRTDDSTAFKNAILTGKRVVCDASKKYYFGKAVDVRTVSKGHLDINNATLMNFHILINLNDSGNDWRQSYPVDKFIIENGAIGSDNWSTVPKDWQTPAIMTGCQMQLRNINFVNQPYILAVANQYLDYMLFDTLLNVQNPELFKSGTLNLDAVNCISATGTAKRIDDKDTNLSGDSWIFKQCSEFYNKYNPEYRLVCTHGHQPMVFQSCIQSGVKTGLYSQVLFLGCHWEEERTMPVFGMKYLSTITFDSCFFWGNYKLENDPHAYYRNCKFTQTDANDRLPHKTLAEFTDNKPFYELQCVLEGCCIGGNYVVDTRKLKEIKNADKYTHNKFATMKTALESANLNVSTSDRNHAKFAVGNNIYDIYLLSTKKMDLANDYVQKTVNIANAKSKVTMQIANAIGGYGIRVFRTEPNGNIYETYGFTDANFADLETAKNILFNDYGEWATFGFNGSTKEEQLSNVPSPWILVSRKPDVAVNKKVYQAGGVLVTTDNSKIENLNGMVQVTV